MKLSPSEQKERTTIALSQEQQTDFFESLFRKIKEYFSVIFRKDKPLHGKELQDYLLAQTQSDEEREALQKQFDENETYRRKQQEFRDSRKTMDAWYEDEIKKSVMRIPDAKLEDVDKVKEVLAEQIDSESEDAINANQWIEQQQQQVQEKEIMQ